MNRANSRRFFAYFLSTLIFAGVLFVSPLQSFAQNTEEPQFGPGSPAVTQAQATINQNTNGQSQTVKEQVDTGECSWFDWQSCLKFLNPLVLLGWIYNALLVPLFSWVLWLSAKLFDVSLVLSLTSITQILKLNVIAEGWKAVRDVCNLFFIFILIFISIKTILGGGSYNTKQMLGKTIMSALLINFSLYITEVIIDASNIVAVWFYNAILSLSSNGASFSDVIRQTLVLDKLFATAPSGDIFSGAAWGSQLSAIAAGQLRLSVIGAGIYVFFRLTFMFIGRSVAFIILAIMSPIAFMGGVFPPLASEARDWWDEMKNNALLAPIFLLFLYVTLRVANAIQGPNAQAVINIPGGEGGLLVKASAASSTATLSFTNMLMVILILMLIMRCLTIAKKYSSKMGNMFSDALKSAVSLVVGLIGVGAVGKVASIAMKSQAVGGTLSQIATGKATGMLTKHIPSRVGTLGLSGLDSATKSDFGIAAARSDFTKLTGSAPRNPLTLGLTSLGADYEKGGYKGAVDASVKQARTIPKLLRGRDEEETLAMREAFSKSEPDSLMNTIKFGMDSRAKKEISDGIKEQTAKDSGKYIGEQEKLASEKLAASEKEAMLAHNETLRKLEEGQKNKIDELDKKIASETTSLNATGPGPDYNGNTVEQSKQIIAELEKQKATLQKESLVQKETLKDNLDGLAGEGIDINKTLQGGLTGMFATMEQKFNESVIGPMSQNLQKINTDITAASGDRKIALEKEKTLREEELDTRKKSLEESKTFFANLSEKEAAKMIKTATDNPAIISSLAETAKARKSVGEAKQQKEKYSDMRKKTEDKEMAAIMGAIKKATGSESKPSTPPAPTA